MIKTLKAQNKDVDKCIFRSQENIQMDSVVGWRDKNGEKHSYLDFYDDEDMIFDTDEL